MKIRIDELKIGDAVDLYGDVFADPDKDPLNAYEFEYVEVCEIERETTRCMLVGFEGAGAVGFPPEHMVEIRDRASPPVTPPAG